MRCYKWKYNWGMVSGYQWCLPEFTLVPYDRWIFKQTRLSWELTAMTQNSGMKCDDTMLCTRSRVQCITVLRWSIRVCITMLHGSKVRQPIQWLEVIRYSYGRKQADHGHSNAKQHKEVLRWHGAAECLRTLQGVWGRCRVLRTLPGVWNCYRVFENAAVCFENAA